MDQSDAVDAVALRARVGALEALVGRLQHELATPLLTASGFARIATERADTSEPVREALERVVDGVGRARAVLTVAADLMAEGGLASVDMAVLLVEAAAGSRRGPAVVTVDVTGPIPCTGGEGPLAELAAVLVELFATAATGPTRLAVDVQRQAAASSLLVTIVGGSGPWPAAALAAAAELEHGPVTIAAAGEAVDPGGDPTVAAVRCAARLAETQLGRLWLDPDGTEQRATVRLLSARDDAEAP